MKIVSKRLWFRPINENDIEKLRQWRNVNRQHFFDSKEISEREQERWFRLYKASPPGTDIIFIPTTVGNEEIGTIGLYNVEMSTRTAELGRVLVRHPYRGKKYAEEMVERVRDFAFETMRLHKIVVKTDLTNNAALEIYLKTGFKVVSQEFKQVDKFSYRIILVLEHLNPDQDPNKPLQIVEV